MINKIFICDVCNQEIDKDFMKNISDSLDDYYTCCITVVFLTDQTKGKIRSPYLSIEKLHICPNCWSKITIQGRQLFGICDHGVNEYFFKEIPVELKNTSVKQYLNDNGENNELER